MDNPPYFTRKTLLGYASVCALDLIYIERGGSGRVKVRVSTPDRRQWIVCDRECAHNADVCYIALQGARALSNVTNSVTLKRN